jgi:hypothetical protein
MLSCLQHLSTGPNAGSISAVDASDHTQQRHLTGRAREVLQITRLLVQYCMYIPHDSFPSAVAHQKAFLLCCKQSSSKECKQTALAQNLQICRSTTLVLRFMHSQALLCINKCTHWQYTWTSQCLAQVLSDVLAGHSTYNKHTTSLAQLH